MLPSIDRPYHVCARCRRHRRDHHQCDIGEAASLDGNHVLSFDQTGAAQKWGPVLSSLIVCSSNEGMVANNVGLAAQTFISRSICFGAADGKNLMRCRPDARRR